MLTKDKLKYYDCRLAGNPNKYYHDIVNNEVVKPPHSRRLGYTDFFLSKRKGFVPLPDSCTTLKEGGEITDMIQIFTNKKDKEKTTYIMRVNTYMSKIKIFRLGRDWDDSGESNCDIIQVGDALPTIKDGYHRFIKTEFVKGEPRKLFWDGLSLFSPTESDTGVYINKNLSGVVDGQFKDEKNFVSGLYQKFTLNSALTGNLIQVGDYIYTYGNYSSFVNGESGVPGQVGIVTGTTNQGRNLNVRAAWQGIYPGQEEGNNLRYKIFPEWGEVFLVSTSNGLVSWTYDSPVGDNDGFVLSPFSNSSADFVSQNGGSIVTIDEQGYLLYGGVGTNQFYRSSTEAVFVGPDTIAAPTFQQYTLIFKSDGLSVVKFGRTTDGKLVYSYNNSDLNIGLYSKLAFDNYKSDFYFLGSNKRLYALTISPTTYGTYNTKLEDMSQYIKGELENIGDTDKVYLQATEQNLRIFIVGDTRNNGMYTKTKILIYNKDYKFRHKWETCSHVITQQKYGFYIGDNIYNYCGYKDKQCTSENTYTQKISLFMGENNTIIPDVNFWQQKKINEVMMTVGKNSVVTNGNTHFDIDIHTNLAKPKFRVSNLGDSPYFKLLKGIKDGTVEQVPEDMKQLIEDNSYYINDCDKSGDSYDNLVSSNKCGCPDEKPEIDDYCVCLDEKEYYVSPESKLTISVLGEARGNMHEITLRSQGEDSIEFGGFLIPYYIKLPTEKDVFCKNVIVGDKCDKNGIICNCANGLNKTECSC